MHINYNVHKYFFFLCPLLLRLPQTVQARCRKNGAGIYQLIFGAIPEAERMSLHRPLILTRQHNLQCFPMVRYLIGSLMSRGLRVSE